VNTLVAGILTALLAPAIAWGEATVVHDSGDVTDVLRQVSHRTALPMDQLKGVHINELTSRPPTVAGAGALRHCATKPIRANDIRALQLRAEVAWRDGERQHAIDQLDLGITQLGCLTDRVDRKVATRMFLLRAGMLAEAGESTDAHEELRSALAMSPDAAWDDKLPSAGRELLEQVRQEPESAKVSVSPTLTTAPWVDGQPIPNALPLPRRVGLHLAQVPSTSGLQSAWLTLDGAATIVVPAGFRGDVLAGMADETSRQHLLKLFEATVGDKPTYVHWHNALWLITRDDAGPHVEVLEAPAAEETLAPDKKPDKKKDRARRR